MANRTIQFYGLAYGKANVELTAKINGETVFSGQVPTIDAPLPPADTPLVDATVLFSLVDSPLFPQDFGGSYPMTVEVLTGNGVFFGNTYSNYMDQITDIARIGNSSINGTTLTVGTVIKGNVQVGQQVAGPGPSTDNNLIAENTSIISGSGSTWTVTNNQTIGPINMACIDGTQGSPDAFFPCYRGIPTNSEGTPDSRSSVTINGIQQVPPSPKSQGQYTWVVPVGSTLGYNFNVSSGMLVLVMFSKIQ